MTQPPPAPRAFPFSAAPFGIRFLLLFGGLWALIGLAVMTVFSLVGQPVWTDWILDARGVTEWATPAEVNATSSRVNGRSVYEITATAGAQQLLVTSSEPGVIDRAQRGERLHITWDPSDPSRARLEGERASFIGPFILIPFFFAFSGVVLVIIAWARLRRVRAVFVNGEAALASVRNVERTSIRINGQPMFKTSYEFRAGMQSTTGHYLTPTPPAVGAELWVLYLPNDPASSSPYERT